MTDTTIPVPATGAHLALVTPLPPDRNPAIIYLARLSPGSRRTMHAALNQMAATLTGGRCDALNVAWQQVHYQHCAALRSILAVRYAAATTNKMLAALRGVLKECWRLGLVDAESYHRAVDLEGVRGSSLLRGRALSSEEIRRLFAACAADPTAAGARDAALLASLYGAGIRRSEAVALDVGDFDANTGELVIRAGKGNKARTTYVPTSAARAISAWLGVRGSEAGALFGPVDKAGRVTIRRISAEAVYRALVKRAAQAGVATFSPHDLRRSFVSDLLDAGADVSAVRALAGHSSIATTALYDRRGEVAKQRAIALLRVPYSPASTS